MDCKTFKIGGGEIRFEEEKVVILDKEKRNKMIFLLWTFSGVCLGVLFLFKTFDFDSVFQFWIGAFVGATHLVAFISILFRSTQSEIANNQITSLKFKKQGIEGFDKSFLIVKMLDGKKRVVSNLGDHSTDIKRYINSHFTSLL